MVSIRIKVHSLCAKHVAQESIHINVHKVFSIVLLVQRDTIKEVRENLSVTVVKKTSILHRQEQLNVFCALADTILVVNLK